MKSSDDEHDHEQDLDAARPREHESLISSEQHFSSTDSNRYNGDASRRHPYHPHPYSYYQHHTASPSPRAAGVVELSVRVPLSHVVVIPRRTSSSSSAMAAQGSSSKRTRRLIISCIVLAIMVVIIKLPMDWVLIRRMIHHSNITSSTSNTNGVTGYNVPWLSSSQDDEDEKEKGESGGSSTNGTTLTAGEGINNDNKASAWWPNWNAHVYSANQTASSSTASTSQHTNLTNKANNKHDEKEKSSNSYNKLHPSPATSNDVLSRYDDDFFFSLRHQQEHTTTTTNNSTKSKEEEEETSTDQLHEKRTRSKYTSTSSSSSTTNEIMKAATKINEKEKKDSNIGPSLISTIPPTEVVVTSNTIQTEESEPLG